MEDNIKMNVCRLCLNISVGSAEAVDRNIITGLIPHINLDLTSEYTVCAECSKRLLVFLEFKTSCGVNNSCKRNLSSEEDATDSLKKEDCDYQRKLDVNSEACCLCLKIIKPDILNNSNEGQENMAFQKLMIEKCLPHIAATLDSNFLLCELCLEQLENSFTFVEICSETEQKIKTYNAARGTTTSPITLSEVLRFSSSDTKSVVKLENKCHDESESNKFLSEEIPSNFCIKTEDDDKYENLGISNTGIIKLSQKPGYRTYKLFKCLQCTFETKIKANLDMHKIDHEPLDKIKWHQCTICDYRSRHLKFLKGHYTSQHKESLQEKGDATDEKSIEQEKPFACDKCPYRGKLAHHLRFHYKGEHEKEEERPTVFNCRYCPYQTRNIRCLHQHHSSHRTLTIKCPECPYIAKNATRLWNHRAIHDAPKFKCSQCTYVTRQRGTLQRHENLHKNPDEVKWQRCEHCPYKTIQKGTLKFHMLKHKKPDEIELFPCDKCEFKAKTKNILKRHMLVHKNEKDIMIYKCDQCPFETRHKGSLISHYSLQHKEISDIPLYPCVKCEYVGKTKNSLKLHLLRHKNVDEMETYKCAQCPYTTIWKSRISRHMVIHTEKIYKCSDCPFTTRYKKSLPLHMQSHKVKSEEPETTESHSTASTHLTNGSIDFEGEQDSLNSC